MDEFLVKPPDGTGGVTPLGESNPEITESLVTDNFNIYSNAITITLKGAHPVRLMADKLEKQYDFFKKLIKNIISDQVFSYIFYFEKHKCGSWIHAHGIIQPRTKSSILNIKQQIYFAIEKQKLKTGLSYKRRILIETIHDVHTWWNYCRKEEELMLNSECPQIKKIYKFIHKNKNDKFLLNFD